MGPVREGILKFRAARELRRRGFESDEIDLAFKMVPGAVGAAVRDAKAEDGVAALGDGTLIAAFLDWLKSDQGQAVLAALVKILLAALGV